MGILTKCAEFLIQSKVDGVRFDETLTLGRQSLLVSPVRLAGMLRRHGCWPDGLTEAEFDRDLCREPYLADPFFRILGAKNVSALDYSDFEDADVIHDLNLPIGPDLRERFDVVIDGGLLEHVFNFPTAIKNCMEMVKVGGRLILLTPANNFFGHGFYQFSPELFFRVLDKSNGFVVERMYAAEEDTEGSSFLGRAYRWERMGPFYDVADPAKQHARVLLRNKFPVLLHIQARRIHNGPIFHSFPQQSDYTATWAGHQQAIAPQPAREPQPAGRAGRLSLKSKLHLKLYLIQRIMRLANPFYWPWTYRKRSFRNRHIYRKVQDKPRVGSTPGPVYSSSAVSAAREVIDG